MRPFSRLRRQLPQRGSQETCFPLRGKSREAGMGVNLRRSRGPQLSYLDSIFENPVIVIYQKDLSTRRSCSDFYGQCQLACFHPWGSVSLDSRSPAAPYESSSLATARDDVKRGVTNGGGRNAAGPDPLEVEGSRSHPFACSFSQPSAAGEPAFLTASR